MGSPLDHSDLLMDAYHVDQREGRAATMRLGRAKREEININDAVLPHAGVLEADNDEFLQRHLGLSDAPDNDAVHEYIRFSVSRAQSYRSTSFTFYCSSPSTAYFVLNIARSDTPPRRVFATGCSHSSCSPLSTRHLSHVNPSSGCH